MSHRFHIGLVVAMLWSASPVLADDSTYDELVQEGVAEFGRGNWEESYLLFSQAHAEQPNARTFRGMGMSAYEARQYVRAVVNLQAALKDERRALDDAQRESVETLMVKSERFIARMTLVVSPADAVIEVDSRKPTLDGDGRLLLERGTHEITVKAPGHLPTIRRLVVRAGETGTLEITLDSEASDTADAVEPAPVVEDASAPDDMGTEPNYVPIIVSGGAAVVFGVTAVVLQMMASGEADDIRDSCPDATCTPDEVENRIDDVDSLQTMSIVSWAATGAALIAAGVFYYIEFGSESAATGQTTSVGLGISPNGLALRGRF